MVGICVHSYTVFAHNWFCIVILKILKIFSDKPPLFLLQPCWDDNIWHNYGEAVWRWPGIGERSVLTVFSQTLQTDHKRCLDNMSPQWQYEPPNNNNIDTTTTETALTTEMTQTTTITSTNTYNKEDKPYKRSQSQGQDHVNKKACCCSNSYCLLSCQEPPDPPMWPPGLLAKQILPIPCLSYWWKDCRGEGRVFSVLALSVETLEMAHACLFCWYDFFPSVLCIAER